MATPSVCISALLHAYLRRGINYFDGSTLILVGTANLWMYARARHFSFLPRGMTFAPLHFQNASLSRKYTEYICFPLASASSLLAVMFHPSLPNSSHNLSPFLHIHISWLSRIDVVHCISDKLHDILRNWSWYVSPGRADSTGISSTKSLAQTHYTQIERNCLSYSYTSILYHVHQMIFTKFISILYKLNVIWKNVVHPLRK